MKLSDESRTKSVRARARAWKRDCSSVSQQVFKSEGTRDECGTAEVAMARKKAFFLRERSA